MSGAYNRTWSCCQNSRSLSAGAVTEESSYVLVRLMSSGTITIAQPAGLEDASQLAHRGGVILDVLEHVAAQDRVERAVGELMWVMSSWSSPTCRI